MPKTKKKKKESSKSLVLDFDLWLYLISKGDILPNVDYILSYVDYATHIPIKVCSSNCCYMFFLIFNFLLRKFYLWKFYCHRRCQLSWGIRNRVLTVKCRIIECEKVSRTFTKQCKIHSHTNKLFSCFFKCDSSLIHTCRIKLALEEPITVHEYRDKECLKAQIYILYFRLMHTGEQFDELSDYGLSGSAIKTQQRCPT